MPGCDRMSSFRFHDVNVVGRLMDIPFQNGLRSFFRTKTIGFTLMACFIVHSVVHNASLSEGEVKPW